jgi:hypothetical protein
LGTAVSNAGGGEQRPWQGGMILGTPWMEQVVPVEGHLLRTRPVPVTDRATKHGRSS